MHNQVGVTIHGLLGDGTDLVAETAAPMVMLARPTSSVTIQMTGSTDSCGR
jgi:hypothetical protein